MYFFHWIYSKNGQTYLQLQNRLTPPLPSCLNSSHSHNLYSFIHLFIQSLNNKMWASVHGAFNRKCIFFFQNLSGAVHKICMFQWFHTLFIIFFLSHFFCRLNSHPKNVNANLANVRFALTLLLPPHHNTPRVRVSI